MICKNCGANLSENVKFCGECGSPVKKEYSDIAKEEVRSEHIQQNVVEENPKKNKSFFKMFLKVAKAIVAIYVFAIFIGACMSSGDNESKSNSTSKPKTKTEFKFNNDQTKFLNSLGFTEFKNLKDHGSYKTFIFGGNKYEVRVNKENGITEVVKNIGNTGWYVWNDRDGRMTPPDNDGKYIIVSIDRLNDILEANAARASKNWKGRYIKFTGYIENIDSDGEYISVSGYRDDLLRSFLCMIDSKEHKNIVLRKDVGDKVTIKGKIDDVGEILGYRIEVDEIN